MIATKSPPEGELGLDTVVREFTRKIGLTAAEIDNQCLQIDSEIVRVKGATARLLTEKYLAAESAYVQLTAGLDAIVNALSAKKLELRSALTFARLDEEYKRIDLDFLRHSRRRSRRHDMPLPAFVLFSVDDAVCRLEVQVERARSGPPMTTSISPSLLSTYWSYFIERMQIRSMNRFSRPGVNSVSCGLESGFGDSKIPESVREKIVEATPLFDHIYLLAEAPDWDYQIKVSRKRLNARLDPALLALLDPLVIGEKGGYFWLIDAFDLTPAESYLREFTYEL